MIFVTVGSMFPFDRLIRAIDELAGAGKLQDDVLAQIGDGRFVPIHIRYRRFMNRPEYELAIGESSSMVAHAGMGTIEMALAAGKPLLVVPRSGRLGEHVNDHQVATAEKFEHLGHVLAAYDVDSIPAALDRLATFVPTPRSADRHGLALRIGRFIDDVLERKQA